MMTNRNWIFILGDFLKGRMEGSFAMSVCVILHYQAGEMPMSAQNAVNYTAVRALNRCLGEMVNVFAKAY